MGTASECVEEGCQDCGRATGTCRERKKKTFRHERGETRTKHTMEKRDKRGGDALYLPQCVSHVGCFDITAVVRRTSKTNRGAESEPQMMEEIMGVVPVTPHERDQENCAEQVMGFLVPLMKEEIAKVILPSLQERIHERLAECPEVFEPLIKEEIVEMLQLLPQEYSQELVVGPLGSFLFDKVS